MDTDRTLRHDAKNLVNSIRLNVEVLRMADSVNELLECLEAIERSAEEGIAWVDRFEAFHAELASPNLDPPSK